MSGEDTRLDIWQQAKCTKILPSPRTFKVAHYTLGLRLGGWGGSPFYNPAFIFPLRVPAPASLMSFFRVWFSINHRTRQTRGLPRCLLMHESLERAGEIGIC
ncbi:hypothetical protein Zmor_023410 [Zophobas morio]|uniref:Uncharacterized protein n=1 Tax=Zophobas morio TaxID=2755281 RepID=A0AA38I0J8_9CUCU|nr:hypothetical protein Zmor_023410 [Zophobas morio]